MRALFVLLLLSNALVFVYFQWWSPREVPPPEPAFPVGGSLTLVGETEQSAEDGEQATAPAEPRAPNDTALAGPICYRSPSLGGSQAAEATRARDAGDAMRSEIREEQVSVTIGYWVYLPPLESREAALAQVAELAEAGVEDVVVVTDNIYTNAVSLGVFSNEERAALRRDELVALGFPAESGERERLQTQYYVVAEWPRQPSIIPAEWRVVDCQA
ncbi:hypothetical protein J2T57_004371 [Natronocella acetinitrilica]|uniref:SPOR domain-containing protein n=1 Tax=Natronocella acetinitrilica TaxID=414046 RepID=A0AAE3KDT4_9GAMM|nr:SPOR domain-containing protein [Natronocella acetinitrilica]MCP1677194.1 hypothetical protein [Natronocella acetinitrilica]